MVNGKDKQSDEQVAIPDSFFEEPCSIQSSELVSTYLNGAVVLVTGAGGSIGSELVRQVLKYGISKLVILDRAENNLFEIRQEVDYINADVNCEVVLCDIQNRQGLINVFENTKPSVVFHTAAYKHISFVEDYPIEAVFNNILGSRNLLEVCSGFRVPTFINISTDKSVNPKSVMGISKKIVESLVHLYGQQNSFRNYISVRFGNVIGSSGSVIPLFDRQIANGGPVTVTHPEMVRYFMTISDAAKLVLQATAVGEHGMVYLLDMGEPVKILDLAKKLIEDKGLRVGEDIAIRFVGTRPGEKLVEELYNIDEQQFPTECDNIFAVKVKPIANILKYILMLEDRAIKGKTNDIRTILEECS